MKVSASNSADNLVWDSELKYPSLISSLSLSLSLKQKKNVYTWLIGLVGRMFTIGLGDLGSISGCIIPKTLKMVLDTSLLNTQQYKVCIEGKVEQSRERSSALPYTLV